MLETNKSVNKNIYIYIYIYLKKTKYDIIIASQGKQCGSKKLTGSFEM